MFPSILSTPSCTLPSHNSASTTRTRTITTSTVPLDCRLSRAVLAEEAHETSTLASIALRSGRIHLMYLMHAWGQCYIGVVVVQLLWPSVTVIALLAPHLRREIMAKPRNLHTTVITTDRSQPTIRAIWGHSNTSHHLGWAGTPTGTGFACGTKG